MMIFAWLFLSNHCALSAIAQQMQTDHCANCEAHSSRPHQEPVSHEMPCCQTAKPVLPAHADAPAYDLSAFSPAPFAVSEFLNSGLLESPLAVSGFDSDPPGAQSFAENVLQRSIPAHAPPLFS